MLLKKWKSQKEWFYTQPTKIASLQLAISEHLISFPDNQLGPHGGITINWGHIKLPHLDPTDNLRGPYLHPRQLAGATWWHYSQQWFDRPDYHCYGFTENGPKIWLSLQLRAQLAFYSVSACSSVSSDSDYFIISVRPYLHCTVYKLVWE